MLEIFSSFNEIPRLSIYTCSNQSFKEKDFFLSCYLPYSKNFVYARKNKKFLRFDKNSCLKEFFYNWIKIQTQIQTLILDQSEG